MLTGLSRLFADCRTLRLDDASRAKAQQAYMQLSWADSRPECARSSMRLTAADSLCSSADAAKKAWHAHHCRLSPAPTAAVLRLTGAEAEEDQVCAGHKLLREALLAVQDDVGAWGVHDIHLQPAALSCAVLAEDTSGWLPKSEGCKQVSMQHGAARLQASQTEDGSSPVPDAAGALARTARSCRPTPAPAPGAHLPCRNASAGDTVQQGAGTLLQVLIHLARSLPCR